MRRARWWRPGPGRGSRSRREIKVDAAPHGSAGASPSRLSATETSCFICSLSVNVMAKTKKKGQHGGVSGGPLLNRELSWLEFNDRVLREGLSNELPLIERLKFLAIASSNLDEFFMIRVAGLKQQRSAGVRKRDAAGMTPSQQLKAIAQRAHEMVDEQTAGIREVFSQLTGHGLFVYGPDDWTLPQRRFLKSHFARELLPVLTPLALDDLQPRPLVPGLQLCVALLIEDERRPGPGYKVAVVPVPSRLPRFLSLPGEHEGLHLVRLEDVIAENAAELFPGCRILSTAVCRITRDADVAIQDDDVSDLLNAVQEAVLDRRRRMAVRLEVSPTATSGCCDGLPRGWT